MTGARARALFEAGITTPELLATAAEADVVKAVMAALPRNMRAAKPGMSCRTSAPGLVRPPMSEPESRSRPTK